MKKILFFSLMASLLMIGMHKSKNPIETEAATSHHIVVDITAPKTYNKVLNTGYYIFVNENLSFKASMIIGDATVYCDYMNIADVLYEFDDEVVIDLNDATSVSDMLSEFDSYHKITANNASWITNIMYVKVNTFAVFDPNPTEEMCHLEVFYAESIPVSTDTTIAGGKTHLINVENPLTLDELKARYTATDKVDGDISEKLQFTTDYDPENIAPRNYYILASVTDNAGHTAYAADIILVKDVTNPTTTLTQSQVIIEVGTVYTLEDVKQLFTFSDNFSKGEKLHTYILDFYKDAYNKVGEYTVQGRCQDEAGNYSDYVTLKIKIVDTQAPDIFLNNNSNKLIATHQLTDDEIKNHFRVEDNYYTMSNTEIEVVSNSCNGDEGVDFELVVAVTDPSGNRCEKTFLYYLADTQAPIINVSNTIYIEEGTLLTNAQFIELLKEVGAIGDDVIDVSFTEEESTETHTTISFTATYVDGTVEKNQVILEYYPKKKTPEENNDYSYLIIIGLASLLVIGSGLIVLKKKKH